MLSLLPLDVTCPPLEIVITPVPGPCPTVMIDEFVHVEPAPLTRTVPLPPLLEPTMLLALETTAPPVMLSVPVPAPPTVRLLALFHVAPAPVMLTVATLAEPLAIVDAPL